MEDVIAAITQYSRDIVQKDLNSVEVLPDWMNNPLPLDRSSSNRKILIPQLIKTVGNDCNIFAKYFRKIESQEAMVLFCASAASGVGKTHLAYAAGLTGLCISIVIRIAQQREENGKAAFSAPWISLFKQLDRFEEYRKTAANCQKSKIANHAYRYIKLLILCYVHVTHIAIGDTADDMDICTKCELALRFHRNGRGEALISNYFNSRIAEMQITDEETRLAVINSEAMDNFYAEVKSSSTMEFPCLLCFDEIQTLFDKYSELFLSQQQYLSQKSDVMKDGVDDLDSTIDSRRHEGFQLPPISAKEGHQHSRGIFYVLCCAMCELAKECEWYMYMTGTSFSMTKFRKTAHDYSPVRGNVKIVAPRALFSLQHMVSTLKHYWNIEDSVLENQEVQKALKFCEGRPLLFVNGVFVPLYHECESYDFSGLISESCLLSVINRGVSDLCSEFSTRMSNVLEGGKSFPLDQSKTSRYFLPHLVKALLFDNGKMVLNDKLGIGEAIATSLVPACADPKNSNIHNDQEIDINAEPLVAHVLKSVILNELQTGIHDMLKLLIETKLCVGKGDVAEIAFAYSLALLTYQHQILCNGNGIDFADLVMPMFTSDRHLLPELVDQFSCFACRVVDCSNIKRECAFRRFVRDDGSVDDTIILTNLPKRMGVDTAFIVSNRSDRTDKRVVVAQHKNDTSITLSEVMATLSPGTQYLSNTQRQAVLSGKKITDKVRSDFNASNYGAGYSDWVDFMKFAEVYPWMTRKWFRLAVVARNIAPEVYTFAQTGIYEHMKSEFKVRRLFGIRTAYLSALEAYKESPVVFLSMNSERWMTEDIRNLFVTKGKGSMALVRGVATWIPCSLDDAAKYCVRAGVDLL